MIAPAADACAHRPLPVSHSCSCCCSGSCDFAAATTLHVDCGWHLSATRSVFCKRVALPYLRGVCCSWTQAFCSAGSNEEGIHELIAAARQELDGLHVDYEGTVQRKLDIARRLFQLEGAASMQVR